MFDALLKSKFYSKCKTAIKITRTRIELIKRKRNAMEKFLRKDIEDLLKDGLDINAYGRAEGLLIELNMSACYDFVQQFCGCILNHLSTMDKQRECPGECKEAVQSLMFAAARFADLPELREIRTIFMERYGKPTEAYVNQEFVERLKAMPPTKEMKIQLLQNMALESGKSWDSKALEQKLYYPPPSEQNGSETTNDEKHKLPKDEYEPHKKNNKDVKNNMQNVSNTAPRKIKDLPSSRRKVNEDKYKRQANKTNAVHAADSESISQSNSERNMDEEELDEKKHIQSKFAPPYYKRTSNEVKYELPANRNNVGHEGDSENVPCKDIRVTSFDQYKHQNKSNSEGNVHEEKTEANKHFQSKFAPPPYRRRRFSEDMDKLQANETGALHGEDSEILPSKDNRETCFDQNRHQSESNSERNVRAEKSDEKKHFESKFAPPYTRPKAGKPEISLGASPSNSHLIEEDTHHQDDPDIKAKPKPRSVRSVRSRRLQPPPSHEIIDKDEDNLDAIRGHKSTKKDIHDEKDEDEMEINKLLLHYSKKENPNKVGEVKAALKLPPGRQSSGDAYKPLKYGMKDDNSARASSLSPESVSPLEKRKEHARASSFQPDTGRVHPKLPDYDNFVARFSAFRRD